MNYYAVQGYNPGIYNTWDECREQTEGFNGQNFVNFQKIRC